MEVGDRKRAGDGDETNVGVGSRQKEDGGDEKKSKE